MQTTAIYAVKYIAARHGHISILKNVGFTTAAIDTTTNRKFFKSRGLFVINSRIILSAVFHYGIARYFSIFSTAKHVTVDMGT